MLYILLNFSKKARFPLLIQMKSPWKENI